MKNQYCPLHNALVYHGLVPVAVVLDECKLGKCMQTSQEKVVAQINGWIQDMVWQVIFLPCDTRYDARDVGLDLGAVVRVRLPLYKIVDFDLAFLDR